MAGRQLKAATQPASPTDAHLQAHVRYGPGGARSALTMWAISCRTTFCLTRGAPPGSASAHSHGALQAKTGSACRMPSFPLGEPTPENKIAQGAVAEVLSAVYEADFLGLSYGFRKRVNWPRCQSAASSFVQRLLRDRALDCLDQHLHEPPRAGLPCFIASSDTNCVVDVLARGIGIWQRFDTAPSPGTEFAGQSGHPRSRRSISLPPLSPANGESLFRSGSS